MQMLLSGLDARKLGVHACPDSQELFLGWIVIPRRERIVP
jgi:hypothetical protein